MIRVKNIFNKNKNSHKNYAKGGGYGDWIPSHLLSRAGSTWLACSPTTGTPRKGIGVKICYLQVGCTFMGPKSWLCLSCFLHAFTFPFYSSAQESGPMSGLAYCAGLAVYQGALNPARALGPAVVANRYFLRDLVTTLSLFSSPLL